MRSFYKKYFLKKKKCCRFFIIIIFLINAFLVYLIVNKTNDFNKTANPVLLNSKLQFCSTDNATNNSSNNQTQYYINYTILNKGYDGDIFVFGELITADTTILLNKALYLEAENTILDTIFFPSIIIANKKVDYRIKLFLADSAGNLYIP